MAHDCGDAFLPRSSKDLQCLPWHRMDEVVLSKVIPDPVVKMTVLPLKKRFRFRP